MLLFLWENQIKIKIVLIIRALFLLSVRFAYRLDSLNIISVVNSLDSRCLSQDVISRGLLRY